MRRHHLALRGLVYYWRTNLAVVLGVATAVAVLTGALLVGDSVRGSLRALVTERLGRADQVVVSSTFFRAALADDLAADAAFTSRFSSVVPLLMAQGFLTAQENGRRVANVAVYGVDDRFWRFHGAPDLAGPGSRDAFLSPALAADLAVGDGGAVLVRLQRPSAIPLESLHSRKSDLGRTVRVTVRRVLARASVGEFSLRPQQGEVRAIFVSLARLQQDLEIAGKANAILTSLAPQAASGDRELSLRELQRLVRQHAALEDVGIRVRTVPASGGFAIESAAGLLDPRQEAGARAALADADVAAQPIFTYLANTIGIGNKEVPYSLVAAMDLPGIPASAGEDPPIVLTDWVARELAAKVGDPATLDYYLWEDPGRLVTRTQRFRVAAVVPLSTGDRDMSPEYPGITDSPTLDDWDPPFPLDLRRVRPQDEAFWRDYRTTPKAFVPLEVGQRLWRSRYGAVTSIRAEGAGASTDALRDDVAARLRRRLDPLDVGLAVRDVRAESLAASRGATDFGEYFVYFSFFLVVSALLLTVLFFKLGIEQRVREVGLMRAVGFRAADVRGVFMREGASLALAGSLLGIGGAVGYAWLVMAGLRTWWVGAVGTTALDLHVSPVSVAGGVAGGFVAATACVWWTLRGLSRVTERSLLAGDLAADARPLENSPHRSRVSLFVAVLLASLAIGLLAGGAGGAVDPAGAFFGAGAALLVAALVAVARVLRRPTSGGVTGRGWGSVSRLGLRNVSYRPGRAVLSMGVVAAATFILVTAGAFRRGETVATTDRGSGLGGYGVMVETLVPLVHDLSTEEGRREVGVKVSAETRLEPFRVLPGDDASCLNLYAPTRPRILGARRSFIEEGRFAFQSSLAQTDGERANPWLLLEQPQADGAIPVIADANSLTYVLHTAVGQDIVVDDNGRPVRLRVVAALRDSVLQGEVVMAESSFVAAFPSQQGYGLVLVESALGETSRIARDLEDALVDYGGDARLTVERLDEFHRVENTYLSTFQTLGGLGLLLGTIGVAAVLLRNVLERRRELALLGAVGYRSTHFLVMAFVENLVLVGVGLLVGGASAWIAVAPALAERGASAPIGTGGVLLLVGVLGTGLASALLATRVTLRAPLLESLRSE
ncbi:MAG TPA: ABC transporter permease [Vicinamibacterales bacterium]